MNGSKNGGKPNRISAFFKRLFDRVRRRKDYDFDTFSKFKRFFEHMSRQDPLYPSVLQSASLCNDALRIARQRIQLSARLHTLDEKLTELECFNNMSDEEIANLKRMLEHFVALTSERGMLLGQLSNYDQSLTEMFKLEEDAVAAMPQIEDAEKYQRALRQDLGYLHGEKEDLADEHEDMARTLDYVHRFTMGMIGIFFFFLLSLAFLYIFGGRDIFLPTTVFILLVMAAITLLYIFRRRISFEVRLNMRKQHRAVELINKKNELFAYYTNYLRFSYKKYKVSNSKKLAANLKDFNSYKFLVNRIDTVRSLMYETENAIERFLREKKLTGVKATIEGFARTVNLEDKKRYYNELHGERETIEKELSGMEARHQEIWETLTVINERDKSDNHIVQEIINTYLSEAEKIFTQPEESANQTTGKEAVST